jgi:hypothetical protein
MKLLNTQEALLVSGGSMAQEMDSGAQDGVGSKNPLSGVGASITIKIGPIEIKIGNC